MMHTLFAVFSPALAVGAAAVAVGVPLVVHLLFRKRYQVVPWAAIRFLLVAERRHKRRIDQWLLLALRTLALVLFLFAMISTTPWAEDLWQKIKPGASETLANVPRTHHVLVIDASLSMTAKAADGEQTRFQRAVAQAENLVRSGNSGDGYTVLVLAAAVQPVVPGPSNDPDKVVAELRKLKPTHGPADHAAALASIADILTRSPRAYPRRQLTFFTDLQRSSWANALPRAENSTADVWQRITSRSDVAVVDAAGRDADNLAVADVTLAEPMPLVDQPVTVTVTVANLGRTERKSARVELLVGRPSGGDALVSVEQKTVDPIAPGGRSSVKFELDSQHRFRDRGVHVLQAKLVGEDELAADDSFARAVEVRDGLHALIVDGRPDPTAERRAATFLARALFPPDAKSSLTPNRPRVVTPADFVDPAVCDLTGVDCVFFCDVPNPTADMAAKLDAVLRRGGTVVFGLGPNAAASRDRYNAELYRDGAGVLPGALGEVVTGTAPDDPGFRLAAEDEEYRRPPLAYFAGDKTRPGLINVLFRTYLKFDAPTARRLMTFARAGTNPASATSAAKPDPALVEWPRHRGRVYVFTSTFNEDWNLWAKAPSYLEFWNEFLTYSVANPDRHTLRVGDDAEEFFPASSAGLTADVTGPGGLSASVKLVLQEEAGVVRFGDTQTSGLYRMGLSGKAREHVFAVNVPEITPGGPTESDLARIDPRELKAPGVQFVPDPAEVKPTSESGAVITTAPKPHGPTVARAAALFAVLFLLTELILAWRLGPSRAATGGGAAPERKPIVRVLTLMAALVPLAVGAFVLFAVLHADRTNNPLGFLPNGPRSQIESAAGVPTANPGEATKWRLEGFTVFFKTGVTDRRAVAALALACVAFTFGVYWVERRAAGGFWRLAVPTLLRSVTFLLALFVILAQRQLAFDREGLPEVVILLDTSASMNTKDEMRDPAVRAKAEELAGTTDLSTTRRLQLAQMLLMRKDADWLDKLLREKQVKVHIFAVDAAAEVRPVATVEEEAQTADARDALKKLEPTGDGSHLGDGVQNVLKKFNGSTLAAIIMFTDGVTTAGDDWPKAATTAARAGVPLFLVGTGDPWQTPDLALTDLQAEDVVGRGDQIVFKARLTARGDVPAAPVTVLLEEKLPNGKREVRGQVVVTPDPNGNPRDVTVTHVPTEVGEKTYILSVPAVPGETNTRNNQIERMVTVTESRRIRVLYVEGYPRYDFRFVKVMLERESDKSAGGKSVEVQVVLLDASKGWAETDRSAFRGDFPTRTELFGFDVVVLGDVDPKQLPRSAVAMRDLADFVKEKGGGLLFLCGEHGTPAAYADTPLAEVLPVIPSDAPMATRPPEEQPTTEGFRPQWTGTGKQHPIFLMSPDEAESTRIWNNFQELLWYAKGYRPKPLARVLAEHPTRRAEGGAANDRHALVVQQYAGNGPVMFFGFDDTWRWRFRTDEEHFDKFWMQSMRVLSRSRVRRPEVRVAPKTEFRRDEKVTVQVRFPIEAPAPAGVAPVRVGMTRSPLLKDDGTPNPGPTETNTLVLTRSPGAEVLFETTLPRAREGEYRFELIDPEVPGSRPFALARVLPPLNETERTELNRADLVAAATISGGGFYTLATATDIFTDLKNLQRVPLNQPCPPVPLWNQPLVYVLLLSLLLTEWLLRKRERLL